MKFHSCISLLILLALEALLSAELMAQTPFSVRSSKLDNPPARSLTHRFICKNSDSQWNVESLASISSAIHKEMIRDKKTLQSQLLIKKQAKWRKTLTFQLNKAQQVPKAPVTQNLSELSNAERWLKRDSEHFKQATPYLLEISNYLHAQGLNLEAEQLNNCIEKQIELRFWVLEKLSNSSDLYSYPEAEKLSDKPALMKDWLDRQFSRVRILASYASAYMGWINSIHESPWQENNSVFNHWNNSLMEIERFTHSNEPHGQVANLNAFFLNRLTAGDQYCARQLPAYISPEHGNDIFSRQRHRAFAQANQLCLPKIHLEWHDLSSRFNRELAGRYPFSNLESRDASPETVMKFISDYQSHRARIGDALKGKLDRQSEQTFLNQMDLVVEFLSRFPDTHQSTSPLIIKVTRITPPGASFNVDQITGWNLNNGIRVTCTSQGSELVEWSWNWPLTIEFHWGNRSNWQPVIDPEQSNMNLGNQRASFSGQGPWALLRLIQNHRIKDTDEEGRTMLGFKIPVKSRQERESLANSGITHIHLALTISGKSCINCTNIPLLPPTFPKVAPISAFK